MGDSENRENQEPEEILKESAQSIEKLRELTDDLEAVVEHEKRLIRD